MKNMLSWQPLSADNAQILANLVPKPTTTQTPLLEQVAAALSVIHRLNPIQHKLGFLPVPRAAHSPAQEQIALFHERLDSLDIQHPILAFALRWAEQHAPRTKHQVVTHGSFHPAAMTFRHGRLASVAEWENAHIGDPLEDVAYYLIRAWQHERSALGQDNDRFIALYEKFSDLRIERPTLAYWQVLASLHLLITRLAEAKEQVNARRLTIDAAHAARHAVELQYEALRLIESIGI